MSLALCSFFRCDSRFYIGIVDDSFVTFEVVSGSFGSDWMPGVLMTFASSDRGILPFFDAALSDRGIDALSYSNIPRGVRGIFYACACHAVHMMFRGCRV